MGSESHRRDRSQACARYQHCFVVFKSSSLALFLLLAGVSSTASQQYDCDSGCKLSTNKVCGSDGYTYANECLAVCQGVTVAKTGACNGDGFFDNLPFIAQPSGNSAARSQEEGAASAPTVNSQVLQLFKEESYSYVGRVKMVRKLSKEHWQLQKEKNYSSPDHPHNITSFNVLRITNSGDAYIRSFKGPDAGLHMTSYTPSSTPDVSVEEASTYPPSASPRTSGRRMHGIIGADERKQCPVSLSPPFSAIGQLIITQTGSEALCTGALFRKDKVITAAHCLYDESASAFVMDVEFAPARYLNSNSKAVDPFGTAKMQFISIADAYFQSKGQAYDYGVLTLQSSIGSRTGTFGIKATSCTDAEYVWSAIAGYPGDKGGTSSQCWYSKCWVLYNKPCSGDVVYYNCDTTVGQSGAPVFDQDRYIRAVHVAAAEMLASDGSRYMANVGTPIYPAIFDAIASV